MDTQTNQLKQTRPS